METNNIKNDLFDYIEETDTVYSGEIKYVLFHNESNNFIIAKFQTDTNIITIKGTIINPAPGLPIQIKGEWEETKNFGNQFKVKEYRIIEPASKEGIIKYLSSGLIHDIGPKFAKKIVEKFGDDTFNILKNHPEKVMSITGIGQKKMESIINFFKDNFIINDIIYFLVSKNISPAYAYKIYEAFKDESVNIIKNNPYKLIEVIDGIGFKKADAIAKEIGIKPNSIFRFKSAAFYILDNAANQDGHTYLPVEEFTKNIAELLQIDEELCKTQLNEIIDNTQIILEENRLYLIWNYQYERYIASKLKLIANSNFKKIYNPDSLIREVERIISITLSDEQYNAIVEALNSKIFILTGGPGTGKTTIIKFITTVFLKNGLSVELCCPTGRAAKRLAEATGLKSSTIHKLLEYSFQKGFQRNERNQLTCDVIIIDEMSMVDLKVFFHLLKAIMNNVRIIIVGDVNQLASVGAGNLLKDIINSNIGKVFQLTKIFRQAENSLIILNSHRINNGEMPIIKNQNRISNFYFIECDDTEKLLDELLTLFLERVPQYFNIFQDNIQILAPIYKSIIGVDNINSIIQKKFNKNEKSLTWGLKNYKIEDRVMQLKNNYDKNVMNGDIGKILSFGKNFDELVENAINKKTVKEWFRNLDVKFKEKINLCMLVQFDENIVYYLPSEFDEITLAYAITIHKSQGSEFKCVLLPVHTAYYIMLARNLIYTAVTRGKELVIMIGAKRALQIALKNDKEKLRYSSLKQRLKEFER